jgi:hypothetical protein
MSDATETGYKPTWDDVSTSVLTRMHIVVKKVNWFSTYRVHHRVAKSWRKNRVFLAGDSAHIHSPVGGQGMNTGIGDAVNLAWKLADVIQGGRLDHEQMLGSYEDERIAFANRLVETTDQGFVFVTQEGSFAKFIRTVVAPALLPVATSPDFVRKFMFRTISQTAINYRNSNINRGSAGEIHGGDRLPWVAPPRKDDADNFRPLSSLDWQVHVHGQVNPDIVRACHDAQLPLHVFHWGDVTDNAGYSKDAAYVVRPDGYVAIAGASSEEIRGLLAVR